MTLHSASCSISACDCSSPMLPPKGMNLDTKLKSLSATNWFGNSFQYELPEKGVVVFTGHNGLGKSSAAVDANCYALHGVTFRATPPRDPGVKMSVVAEYYGGLRIERTEAGKSSKTLAWSLGGEEQGADTNSKRKDALADVICPKDNWKRTHVFAASDLVAFSTATDSERKLLLEEMVGLGQFDVGHKNCLASKRQYSEEANNERRMVAALTSRMEAAQRHLENTEPPALVDVGPLEEESRRLYVEYQAASGTTISLRARVQAAKSTLSRARSTTDTCPTCGSKTNDPQHIRKAIEAATSELVAAETALQEAAALVTPKEHAYAEVYEQLSQAKARNKSSEQLLRAYEAAKKDLDSVESELEEASFTLKIAETNAEIYDLAAKTIQSVRGLMFDETLDSLQELCNQYVARLSESLKVKFEVVPGRAGTESITMLCDNGNGVWREYKALSNGQRRRIDIACLLALSQLNPSTGTLYFDEAFDTLDMEGRAAVSELVTEFGQDRCVVVITPTEEFSQYLSPTRVYRIQDLLKF